RQADALRDMGEARGCISHLLVTMEAKDPKSYEQALDYTRRLHEIFPLVKSRRALLEKLGKSAPGWASAIANRVEPHHGQALPGDHSIAWTWRQLHEELERRHALDAPALQREIDENRIVLREVTISLIDLRAWV